MDRMDRIDRIAGEAGLGLEAIQACAEWLEHMAAEAWGWDGQD
jgi:hypothetical protein